MKGLIAWFARNSVAANLLMIGIIAAGLHAALFKIRLEFFPEFEPNTVSVSVPYRGATPAEAEEAVVVRIEEAIQDLAGIKQITSTAREGSGSVNAEIEDGFEPRDLLDDIKNRVDAISTFPVDTEKPIISLAQSTSLAISVVISGDLDERALRTLGEQIRDEMLADPEISQARLSATRRYEIAIEVPEQVLQRYGLTLEEVARAIRRSSIDLPAGAIKTGSGEVLLRTKGQAYVAADFEEIVVRTESDGTRILVRDIASISDGFTEDPLYARFNGKRAVIVQAYRVGDQNLIEIAEAVGRFAEEAKERLPEGVQLATWRDSSRAVKGRLDTLTGSLLWGILLVIGILALFLRLSLAFWVALGIPIAFCGALAVMPIFNVSANLISLFGFILVLGIVVDDAIVTGERIYTHLHRSDNALEASIRGAQEVAVPVIFGVLTTVAAFVPLLMVDGFRGKMMLQIPAVVIPVLLFSLVESKLILPAHLAHLRPGRIDREKLSPPARLQRRIADGMVSFVENIYTPVLRKALSNRALTLAIFIAVLVVGIGLFAGGRVRFVPFPRVGSEEISARLEMPLGTPAAVTESHLLRVHAAAEELRERHTDPTTGRSGIKNTVMLVGGFGLRWGGGGGGGSPERGEVMFEVAPASEWGGPPLDSQQLARDWRQIIGEIPGVKEFTILSEIGRGGSPIDIEITGLDLERMNVAAIEIKEILRGYESVFDIRDNATDGKQEIQLKIKPEAEQLGLDQSALARQIRQAFYGEEAQRIQRGRDDIRVMVRYPIEERSSLDNLDQMKIRTPDGAEVPFATVAEIGMGRSPASILRKDRRRVLNVVADIDKDAVDISGLRKKLAVDLESVAAGYPGVAFSFEGEAKEERESNASLLFGVFLVFFMLYVLLAVPFRSYIQPLIVMSVIPFGLFGAIVGHMICGHAISLFSTFGMLALSGVVVNDSLVLVDYINRKRREDGLTISEAIMTAGPARFRAVVLTSLTTFGGLVPLIFFEDSTQSQFLIPMAISLGFGILFATFITLILVPVNYLLLEDIKWLFGWRRDIIRIESPPAPGGGEAPFTEGEKPSGVNG
ncbi:MAG: efflux RND transporter permease subunit [Verrucomicrobiales bacterium]